VNRKDRGQPGVAAADGVASLALDLVEERVDHWGVQVGDIEPARGGPMRWAAKPSSSHSVSR
jgi:hypothetical protein